MTECGDAFRVYPRSRINLDLSRFQSRTFSVSRLSCSFLPRPSAMAIFAEPGVNGAKYGLSVLGRVNAEARLPLVPVGPATEALIRRAMVHAGLLNA